MFFRGSYSTVIYIVGLWKYNHVRGKRPWLVILSSYSNVYEMKQRE